VPHVYDVVTVNRGGQRRVHEYTTEETLDPGTVLRLDGRYWLVAEAGEEIVTRPARYRIRMRYPDGREELGAFRRFRPDAPRLGHAFTTVEDRRAESWQVVDERFAFDDGREPYLELVATRDFAEIEELPDHELEHALAQSLESLPEAAAETFARASEAGLAVELVTLEPGEAPDWDEARGYLDALVLEEVDDDLLEQCGVKPDEDPRETWLDRVHERLHADLARFRADVEGDHVAIEEWDYLDGRIFASVGSTEDEADPDAGHGWMCRLVDASVLAAAGFSCVRKSELV
jgi:hypothetical protein